MKKILVTILILAILLGCQKPMEKPQYEEEDLPPTPPMPGQAIATIGKAVGAAIPPWAAAARNMELKPTEIFPGNPLTLSVFEYQYIYQNAYIFNQKTQTWEKMSLFGGDRSKEWIKNSAATSFNADLEKFKYGDNYVLAYACNKIGDRWSCNNNKWMLASFKLKEKPADAVVPEKEETTKYIITAPVAPFTFQTGISEEDNFEEIMVMRYDGEYYEPQTKLKVIVRVFEFNNMNDLTNVMKRFFKDIVNQGWKKHGTQNVALYLDVNDVRNAIWTSGNKLLFIETHNPEFASAEIINAYIKKFPSDLKRVA